MEHAHGPAYWKKEQIRNQQRREFERQRQLELEEADERAASKQIIDSILASASTSQPCSAMNHGYDQQHHHHRQRQFYPARDRHHQQSWCGEEDGYEGEHQDDGDIDALLGLLAPQLRSRIEAHYSRRASKSLHSSNHAGDGDNYGSRHRHHHHAPSVKKHQFHHYDDHKVQQQQLAQAATLKLQARSAAIHKEQQTLNKKQHELAEQQRRLDTLASQLRQRESRVAQQKQEIDQRSAEIARHLKLESLCESQRLSKREKTLAQRECAVAVREAAIKAEADAKAKISQVDGAARTIQRAWRRSMSTKDDRHLLKNLATLRRLDNELSQVVKDHYGNTKTLGEMLTKQLMKADAIESRGESVVRRLRKQYVLRIMALLDQSDRDNEEVTISENTTTAPAPAPVPSTTSTTDFKVTAQELLGNLSTDTESDTGSIEDDASTDSEATDTSESDGEDESGVTGVLESDQSHYDSEDVVEEVSAFSASAYPVNGPGDDGDDTDSENETVANSELAVDVVVVAATAQERQNEEFNVQESLQTEENKTTHDDTDKSSSTSSEEFVVIE